MVTGRDDVHHLHYPEIPGTEADTDLVLVCRGCHDIVHTSIDGSRAWQRTDRRTATWEILALVATRRESAHFAANGSLEARDTT